MVTASGAGEWQVRDGGDDVDQRVGRCELRDLDPCVPVPPDEGAFFATAPIEPDLIPIPIGTQMYDVNSTRVRVGQPRTIDLVLLSDAATAGPWTVEPLDDASLHGLPAVLDLKLDRAQGVNGNKVHMTITAISRPATGYAPYRIRSRLGAMKSAWWGLVAIDP